MSRNVRYKARYGQPITDREIQVLELILRGTTNKGIANSLGISAPTVKNHVQKILCKLGCHGADGRMKAVYVGLVSGLLQPPQLDPKYQEMWKEQLDSRPSIPPTYRRMVKFQPPDPTICRDVQLIVPADWVRHGDVSISPAHRVCFVKSQQLQLWDRELDLLTFFLTVNPGHIWARGVILDRVWGKSSFVEERTVDVHVRRLRQALETVGVLSIIETIRGVGYRLAPLKSTLTQPPSSSDTDSNLTVET